MQVKICVTAIIVDMLHHWHTAEPAVDKGQSVRTVFVDFTKAFDHVDHNVLVSTLVALDLPDSLSDGSVPFCDIEVSVSRSATSCLQLTAGMPQGSYLGPLTLIVILIDLLSDPQIC